MAKKRGNPAVVTKIKPGLEMHEFMRTHQGIEDVADYSKPKKKSKKANGGFVSVSEYVEDII